MMGAWDFGPYRLNFPRMGKLPSRREPTLDEVRQNYAVKSIHKELLMRGFDPGDNPWYSWDTYRAVRQYQKNSTSLNIDGTVGRQTYTSLIKHVVFAREVRFDIPNHYLAGMVTQESGFDPVALGFIDPNDRGLLQINRVHHPDVSDQEAFNPRFAAEWGARRMATASNLFVGKTTELQWDCAIAYHNNPTSAKEWFETEQPPNEKIAGYVANVKKYAATF
jgi:Transglycosylase SLT domain